MTYLVLQKRYFQETGEHLDYYNNWLPENKFERSYLVPHVKWTNNRLKFGAMVPDNSGLDIYCRLAGTFIIEINKKII